MSVITDYIDKQTVPTQELLQPIYDVVHKEVDVEDGWKYSIPTFLYKGKPILGFAKTLKGISIYPYGNSTIDSLLHDEIKPYVTGGGTLSFPTGTPIPNELVARIAQVRKAFVDDTLKK